MNSPVHALLSEFAQTKTSDQVFPSNRKVGEGGVGKDSTWSPVVNSALQPTLGLRWLLCYEEGNRDAVHLQKAAPNSWFAPGEKISARNCPTRFGQLTWTTESLANQSGWVVNLEIPEAVAHPFNAELIVHLHPPGGRILKSSTVGRIVGNSVEISPSDLAGKTTIMVRIQ